MNTLLIPRTAVMLIVALGAASCSSTPRTPPIVRPTGLVVTRLVELRLPERTECIVQVAGETMRGKLVALTSDRLELEVWDSAAARPRQRSFDHAEVLLVARVVKMSKGDRGWLGAAIGALVSLPLGISMVGDMMVPASILGALIGRSTGNSRAEVVFERTAVPPR